MFMQIVATCCTTICSCMLQRSKADLTELCQQLLREQSQVFAVKQKLQETQAEHGQLIQVIISCSVACACCMGVFFPSPSCHLPTTTHCSMHVSFREYG